MEWNEDWIYLPTNKTYMAEQAVVQPIFRNVKNPNPGFTNIRVRGGNIQFINEVSPTRNSSTVNVIVHSRKMTENEIETYHKNIKM